MLSGVIAAVARSGVASFLVAACAVGPRPAAAGLFFPDNLVTQEDLDGIVAEEYASLTNFAFIYPPRTECGTNVCFSHIELWGGWYTCSPEGGIAGVTNYLHSTLRYGIPVWQLAVAETTDVSRVWLYLAPDGASFATNNTPASLDPQQWVRDVYKRGPPSYLAGTAAD
jgi:hypothetical protein